ncbi:hypothetical protein Lal_00022878 [Lupinus albus]|nr:hypothetical protein Lal_00022878 [Lupinus albus]
MKAQAFSLQHPILPVPRFSFNVTPPSLCCSNGENNDGFYIKRCVEIARKGVRYTSPMVGCVIVKDGNVVGQGFHPKAEATHSIARVQCQMSKAAASRSGLVKNKQ